MTDPKYDWTSYLETQTAIAIMGPTASGKTALALALSQTLPVEIINVDSVLIYRDLTIGAAKPSDEELAKVPHHLINLLAQNETYSVADFVRDAQGLATEIFARGRIPLLVGGTMMYFNALSQGLSELPAAEPKIRARLQSEFDHDPVMLHQRLKAIDPIAAERINVADQQRLIRALEVYEISGQTLTHLQQSRAHAWRYNLVKIALIPQSRQRLHDQIALRLQQMFAAGLVDEVNYLVRQPEHDPDSPAMRSVGYRQVLEHVSGLYSADQLFDKALVATRRLAKRQLTWLRKETAAFEVDPYAQTPDELMLRVIEELHRNCKNLLK